MDLTRRLALAMAALALCSLPLALVACGGDEDGAPDLGADATIGRELVRQRGCAKCHAQPSDGDTLAGGVEVMSGMFGSNLTPDTATGLGGWADIEIVRAMRYGVDNQQMELCPSMPRYDGSDPMYPLMTDVEADAIVAWLRALPAVARAVPTSTCPPVKPRPPVDMAVPVTDNGDMTMGNGND